MKISLITCILCITTAVTAAGQEKIRDGSVTSSALPEPNAIMELESNNKGLLQPRVALKHTADAAPLSAHVAGMTVYNTAAAGNVTPGCYYNDGTQWVRVTPAYKEPWHISGTDRPADSNSQYIYQLGKVSIGINPGADQVARMAISESHSAGETRPTVGIRNLVSTNRNGYKYGIWSTLTDSSAKGSGQNIGLFSVVQDYATVEKSAFGGAVTYNLNAARNNAEQNIHGLYSSIALNATGGDLVTGYSYGSASNANGKTVSGNLNISGGLRAYSGYAVPDATAGYTIAVGDLIGGHFTARPTPSGGTVTISYATGVSAQFDPRGSGIINVDIASALNSVTNFSEGSTKNINHLYGFRVEKLESSTGAQTINNAYGIYIQPYRFRGDNAKTAYNFFSEGTDTKNYFQGRVGIGYHAPEAQLHVVKQASDLTPAIIAGCNEYGGNAEAIAAGLPAGALYRSGDLLKVVH